MFLKKIFVAPIKTKSSKDVVQSFNDIHLYIGHTPHTIYMDKVLEFNSNISKNIA